jgi:hypothetical protein
MTANDPALGIERLKADANYQWAAKFPATQINAEAGWEFQYIRLP